MKLNCHCGNLATWKQTGLVATFATKNSILGIGKFTNSQGKIYNLETKNILCIQIFFLHLCYVHCTATKGIVMYNYKRDCLLAKYESFQMHFSNVDYLI